MNKLLRKDNLLLIWFSILVFTQLFVYSFKLNIILQLISLIGLVSLLKPSISYQFFNKIIPLLLLIFIGFIGFFIFDLKWFNALKDLLHFVKPITGLLLGYLFFKAIDNEEKFIELIIYLGLFSALYHFILIVGFTDFLSGNINSLRLNSKDNFLELFSLFFLIYYPKITHSTFVKNQWIIRLIYFILVTSILLYFSRTMLVLLVIFFLTIWGYTRFTRRNLLIISLLLGLIAVFYFVLYSIKIDKRAEGLEAFLYKIKMAPAEVFKAKFNREDHYQLWGHWRAYEAKRALALMKENPSSYIFGMGFGSLVNLKFWAPLGDYKKGMKYISELHNGYVYVFYKTGAIGLLLYLYFLWRLFNMPRPEFRWSSITLSGIGLSFFFTTLIITGLFNPRDIMVFIVGAYFYFNEKQ